MYGKSSGVVGERLEDLAARAGPQRPRQAYARGDVLDGRRPSGRVLADPGEVVLAEGGAGDDPEAFLGEARDREVALDPAAARSASRCR